MGTPTLNEIKSAYKEIVKIMKNVKTIDECRKVQEKHNLTIEINGEFIDDYVEIGGTDEDIEWIRIEAYECLSYIYFFTSGGIFFDVWSDEIDNEFITDTTIKKLDSEYNAGINWIRNFRWYINDEEEDKYGNWKN